MATTNPIAKFVQGSDELNFTTGNLTIRTGTFTPPEYGLTPHISDLALISIEDAEPRPFNFQIVIQVGSEQEGRFEGRRISSFLRRAGNRDNPLYLAFKPNSDVNFEPTTGQIGASIFYPIIHGKGSVGEFYASSDMKTKGWLYNASLALFPYALGLPDLLWSATGGIIIPEKDGRASGIIVAEATTTEMTNPAFSHATYDNGWTAAASLSNERVTNPPLVRTGISSIMVTALAATLNILTQNINVGDTDSYTLSARVRRLDGDEVTATDCDLYYNTALTATFTQDPTDSEWWILEKQGITGISSPTATGLIIKNGYGVIVDFVQFEKKAYRTPFCYGEMLGCAWTGTAHASTSTRTVGRIRRATDDVLNISEGTIVMAVRLTHANNDGPFAAVDCTFFADSTTDTKFNIERDLSTTDWRFGDGTNVASTDVGADSWSANDIRVIVGTWSTANGLNLYVGDTISLDTDSPANAPYTAVAFQTNGYIGSDSTPAGHHNSTYLAFGIFDRELNSTQIQNVYANMRPILATGDGEEVGVFPFLWTNDGDDVVDNSHDTSGSTNAPHQNYAVVYAGGAGVENHLRIDCKLGGSADWPTNKAVYFSNFSVSVDRFSPVITTFYREQSGTGEVTASGGQYQVFPSVSTTVNHIITTGILSAIDIATYEELDERGAAIFARMNDQGSNLTIAPELVTGFNVQIIIGQYEAVSPGTSFVNVYAGEIQLPSLADIGVKRGDGEHDLSVSWGIAAKRTSGTANVEVDLGMMMPNVTQVWKSSHDSNDAVGAIIEGRQAFTYATGGAIPVKVEDYLSVLGRGVTAKPGRLNILQTIIGLAGTSAPGWDIDDTLTYNSIKFTPKLLLI